jgi:hypothetical protein
VWVSFVINDVRFCRKPRYIAVGWKEWVSLMVKVMLFSLGLSVVVVG